MPNPYYSDPALQAYHERNKTGLYNDSGWTRSVGQESLDPQAAAQDLTSAGEALTPGGAAQAGLTSAATGVTSDVIQGKDPTRSAATGLGQAAGAALGAPLGPVGSAIGSAAGGALAGAALGPEEQIIQGEVPQVQQAQFVPIGTGGGQAGPANPFNDGTVGAMQIPGPMSSNPASPDTFINGQIASVHYPKLNEGSEAVSKYGFDPQGRGTGESEGGDVAQGILASGIAEIGAIPLGALKYMGKAGKKIAKELKDLNRLPEVKEGAGPTFTSMGNPIKNFKDAYAGHRGMFSGPAQISRPTAAGMATVDSAFKTGLAHAPVTGVAAALYPWDNSNAHLTGSEGIQANPNAAFAYMGGTHHVPGYNYGAMNVSSTMSPTQAFMGGSFNVSPLNDGTAGAAYGADTIGNLNHGTEGAMMGPMGMPAEFGYVPSGPTMQEMHADMAAAGKENREMMKFQADEKRKTEMHHLKMADMAESSAIKQANMKKGPMAR